MSNTQFHTRWNEAQTYRALDNVIEQEQLEREHQIALKQQEEFAKMLAAKRKALFGKKKPKIVLNGECERFTFFGTFSEVRVFIGQTSGSIRVTTPAFQIYEFGTLDDFATYANEIRVKNGKAPLEITVSEGAN